MPALANVFNESYSDYLVPLHLDEAAFRGQLDSNGIDLECSQVVVDDGPVAFALIACGGAPDGSAAWARFRPSAGAVSASARWLRHLTPLPGGVVATSGLR